MLPRVVQVDPNGPVVSRARAGPCAHVPNNKGSALGNLHVNSGSLSRNYVSK